MSELGSSLEERAKELQELVYYECKSQRKNDQVLMNFDKPTESASMLYHYTNAVGLKGIVTTNTLWASNCLFLNDATEITYGLEVIRTTLAALQVDVEYSKNLLGIIIRDIETIPERVDAFVVCFCKRGDLLSQWHGYGNGGGGYALGFSQESIVAAMAGTHYKLRPVIYDRGTQEEIVQKEFTAASAALATGVEKCESEAEIKVVLARVAVYVLSRYAEAVAQMKDAVFQGEQEWRLIRFRQPIRDSDAVRFRVNSTIVIPYLELPFGGPDTKRISISEIVVGPMVDAGLGRRAVEVLMRECGTATRVIPSKIPLR